MDKLSPDIHLTSINKISGLIPGLISGTLYAAILIVFLVLLPFSKSISEKSSESKLAGGLSWGIEKGQDRFFPILGRLNSSLAKVTIAPGSEKYIKLNFTVIDPEPRPYLEEKMLGMVNKERIAAGLTVLKADPEMRLVARKHSKDMFARGYFSHISPDGASPFDRIRNAKVSFITAGENLALAQTLLTAHTGLMNSPGHKANILHKSFGRLGIGILDGGIYGIMVTQNFRN